MPASGFERKLVMYALQPDTASWWRLETMNTLSEQPYLLLL